MAPARRRSLRALRRRYGLFLLACAGPLVGRLAPGDRRARVAARALGARHVAESLVDADGRVLAAIDAVHAGSMLAVARAQPRLRRAALASAAVSTLLAAAEIGARRCPRADARTLRACKPG